MHKCEEVLSHMSDGNWLPVRLQLHFQAVPKDSDSTVRDPHQETNTTRITSTSPTGASLPTP